MKRKELMILEGVSYSYGDEPLLDQVSLTIFDDDFLGVIGPNGGGKTTLLKLMLGILQPSHGKIVSFGTTARKGRVNIGYLSQFEGIDFDFPITVEQIVSLSKVKVFKRISAADKEDVKWAIARMGLESFKDRKLSELSGGEKQRVFVARALASRPKILILDEPMANIDISHQENFYDLLKELNKDIAIIVVDHNIDMVSRYVKEVACINKCSSHGLRYHGAHAIRMKELCDI